MSLYTTADAYRIMRARLSAGLAESQIESFNDFMHVKIPKCMSEHAPVVVAHEATDSIHTVEMLGVRYDRPSVREANGHWRPVTPAECTIRRITYECNMLISARYTIQERSSGKVQHSVVFRDKVFDKIPCMKHSDFCSTRVDPDAVQGEDASECGGYFVITGAEKVLVAQERPRNNYAFVQRESDGSYRAECRSFNETKFRSTSTLYVQLHPQHATEDLMERRVSPVRISVRIPFVNDALALPTVMKLMHVTDVGAMLDHICTADDPQWLRDQVLAALMFDVDSMLIDRETAITRLAHDRAQPFVQSARKRRSNAAAAAGGAAAPGGAGAPPPPKRRRADEATDRDRSERQVYSLLSSEFLPHQGYTSEALPGKVALFGMMVRKLFRVYYGMQAPDDRDDYAHRRVALASSLMTLLFRKNFTMWRRRLASQIRRELDNGAQFVNIKQMLHANIGSHLVAALSTGNFTMQRGGGSSSDGVAQVLSRTEPAGAAAHTLRSSNPVNKDGRAIEPRLQHPSCCGVVCPWDTPEGQSCGLVRNRAYMAGVRTGYPVDVLVAAITATGVVDTSARTTPIGAMAGRCPVFVNGRLIGLTAAGAQGEAIERLRALRAANDLPRDVSIFHATGPAAALAAGEIHINGDAGALWWPLLRVAELPRLRALLDTVTTEDGLWEALLAGGVVDIVNKDEESAYVRVAMDHAQLAAEPPGTFTHVVIHPSQVCSLYTAKGALIEFNQAPRITYQAAMGKQAIGRALGSQRHRVDTAAHTLWYPQRPLVTTFMTDATAHDGVASVQNPVVAIMCAGGHNIEDSIIFNRRSIQLGLFRSTVFRTIRDTVKLATDTDEERLGLPPDDCRSRLHGSYRKINPETGAVDPGTPIETDDVLIAKYNCSTTRKKLPTGETEQLRRYRDRSTINRAREAATVDEVIFTKSPEGEDVVRLRTRAMRVPEVGDKFCSRYAQKGTIGAVYDEVDMPFSPRSGCTPDLIINAHGQPSRMTIGHILETLCGKAAALRGEQVDGTPFVASADAGDSPDGVVDKYGAQLEAFGFQADGCETLYDGRTGKPLEMQVFVGPVAYSKLRHMVVDKYHARSRGPRSFQTRQPLDGRGRDGGQRVGEMERDCCIAHGASFVLEERLLTSSDQVDVYVCAECGAFAHQPQTTNGNPAHCARCLSSRILRQTIPHGYRLSVQENAALHMDQRIVAA